MKVLVINPGSYSIKSKMIDFDGGNHIAVSVNDIGLNSSYIKMESTSQQRQFSTPISNHGMGINLLLSTFADVLSSCNTTLNDIDAVAVRVVSVPDLSFAVAKATKSLIGKLKENAYLSPVHQGVACEILQNCRTVFKDRVYIVSDSSFYQDIPLCNSLYAIDRNDALTFNIKKNGFHGFSHQYMYEAVKQITQKDDLKVISCHLGGGSSVSAIKGGHCIDTSMGFSPSSGLPMSTRCGDIDAVAVLELMQRKNMTVSDTILYLNTQCGFKGLSQISGDFKEIRASALDGEESAILTLQNFIYNVKKYIGSYYALLNGADCIVFTGAISNYNPDLLKKICQEISALGIDVMAQSEVVAEGVLKLTSASSNIQVYSLKTDEEAIIAKTVKCYLSK